MGYEYFLDALYIYIYMHLSTLETHTVCCDSHEQLPVVHFSPGGALPKYKQTYPQTQNICHITTQGYLKGTTALDRVLHIMLVPVFVNLLIMLQIPILQPSLDSCVYFPKHGQSHSIIHVDSSLFMLFSFFLICALSHSHLSGSMLGLVHRLV